MDMVGQALDGFNSQGLITPAQAASIAAAAAASSSAGSSSATPSTPVAASGSAGGSSGGIGSVATSGPVLGTGVRALGVCPAGLVTRPGGPPPASAAAAASSSPLEPHHSHFVLVPASEWGGETSTMFAVAGAVASRRVPTVALLANGGGISKKEVRAAVRAKLPVIVIEGSGRLADQIARAVHTVDEARGSGAGTPGASPEPAAAGADAPAGASGSTAASSTAAAAAVASIGDGDIREIVGSGLVRLFPVTGHGEALRALMLAMLREQRAGK